MNTLEQMNTLEELCSNRSSVEDEIRLREGLLRFCTSLAVFNKPSFRLLGIFFLIFQSVCAQAEMVSI